MIKFKVISDIHGFVSWGDYTSWEIGPIRNAIIKRYGDKSCSEIKKDKKGFPYFNVLLDADMKQIGKDIGVQHSGPSISSSSSKK